MKPLTQLIVLIGGIVALVAVGVAGMVAIEWLRPDGHNTQLNTEIVGVITIAATQLFGYIKSVINGQQIEKKSEEIKDKLDIAPHEIRQAALLAKDKIEWASANAAQKLMDTASELARKKG